MLVRLYADNYASFVNFEFRPARMCLLVGDNGSGKSKIFQLLGRIVDLTRVGSAVETCFPAPTRTAWERRDAQTFELEVEQPSGRVKYALQIGHESDSSGTRTFIAREEVTLAGKLLFRFSHGRVELFRDDHTSGATFEFSNKRSFLASVESGADNVHLTAFLAWLQKIWRFHLDPAAIKRGWLADREAQALLPDGSNLAAVYRHLVQERPEVVERLQDDLRRVVGGLDRLRLQAVGDRKGLFVDFASSVGASAYRLPFFELSDGQVTLVALYTTLHAVGGVASLLCVDEPDNFLALREIQPWLQGLSDVPNAQAILISHHPEVIDYLAADSVLLLERRGGGMSRIEELQFRHEGGLRASEQIIRGWLGANGGG